MPVDSNVLSGRSNNHADQATPQATCCVRLIMFNLIGIEAEQLSRLVHDALLLLVEWNHVAHFLDVFPKFRLSNFLSSTVSYRSWSWLKVNFFGSNSKLMWWRFQLGLQCFDGSI